MQRRLLDITSVAFDATGPILEKKLEYNEVVHKLFMDFKKALEDPGTYGKIILIWIFRKWDGLIWLRIGRCGLMSTP
jgi:hypothetical protein